jgi:hypothetical protein
MWQNSADAPVVVGLPTEPRQVLCTTTLDARPHHRYEMAGNAISPLLLALTTAGLLVLGGAFHPAGVIVFSVLITLALYGWFWSSGQRPKSATDEEREEVEKHESKSKRDEDERNAEAP